MLMHECRYLQRSDYNVFVQSVYTNVVNMHIATLVVCWVVCLGYFFLLMRPYCVSPTMHAHPDIMTFSHLEPDHT
jgi:hypothetical protein